jgi:hypothetical protein
MVFLPAALALVVLAAGCGGSSGASTDGVASANGSTANRTSGEKNETDPQQAALDFARCMREHGVDMPDPTFDGGGGGVMMVGPGPEAGGTKTGEWPPAGFEEADAACRHFLQDVIGKGDGPVDPEEQDRALRFAQCMRENGVNMPDPDFSGGGVHIRIGDNGSPIDPATVQSAQNACGGMFGPGGGPTKAPGSGERARS